MQRTHIRYTNKIHTRCEHNIQHKVPGMSFDRMGNLGKSSTMKARLQEEVRLVEIAQARG